MSRQHKNQTTIHGKWLSLRNTSCAVFLLMAGCTAANERAGSIEDVQSEYTIVRHIAEQYRAGDYGEVEPASLPRLQLYQSRAYQDIMAFRRDVERSHQLNPPSKAKAQHSVEVMKSYLAALGATSAYEQ